MCLQVRQECTPCVSTRGQEGTMEALAKASTLLAQIEAKLLKLAQRDPDHAAKLAEGLVEDFQNKLDLQRSELRIPSGAPLRNTISLPNLCSIVARKISACHGRWSAYGKLQGKGRRRGSPRSSTKSAPTCSRRRLARSPGAPEECGSGSRSAFFTTVEMHGAPCGHCCCTEPFITTRHAGVRLLMFC
jgi:hypothetical protein